MFVKEKYEFVAIQLVDKKEVSFISSYNVDSFEAHSDIEI